MDNITLYILMLIILCFYIAVKSFLFFKDLDYKHIFNNFSLIRLLGRTYYFNNLLIIAIIDLIVLFKANFTLAWTVEIIICGLLTIPAVIRFIYNFTLYVMSTNFYKKIKDILERCIIFTGVPRCGKTSSMNTSAVIIAKRQFNDLKREYWFWLFRTEERLTAKEKETKDEVIKSYEYYIANIKKFIPCLHAVMPIYVGRRQSHPLSKAHLVQNAPIPYKSVLVVDEVSTFFPNQRKQRLSSEKTENSKQRKNLDKLADLCKYIGQYTDSYLFMTEQFEGSTNKDIRIVTGQNINYTQKQRWLAKPLFLIFIYNIFLWFKDYYLSKVEFCKTGSREYYQAQRTLKKSAKHQHWFLSFLKKLISNIGFRYYKYTSSSSTENEISIVKNRGVIILPSCLNCKYNDRVFREKYKAKDKPFKTPKRFRFFMSENEIMEAFFEDY